MTEDQHPRTLGTALRRLSELLDGEVERAYAAAGLEFRSGYTPVLRALRDVPSLSVRELATATGTSHAAASQSVRRMRGDGLVESAPGSDGRERRVRLTDTARRLLPAVAQQYARTQQAAEALDVELGISLAAVVNRAIGIIERRPFLPPAAEPAPPSTTGHPHA
ncbi:MarR family winged helix-turn-helix transcriptional regulator [Kitasatospora mediocidica]|uniref:MarR family winged helix-turn-helix transcriptional regulator n=1 Tax=Kitasatospora mediocidica TaxID=58352 RepID=UPI0006908FF9|nr:MarR family transcriptional regulator [Kitasatospora mediocidica]